MDNTHPYHSIRIPHDAPFRLGVSPGKGWGAFATRNISKGDVILQEKPLFVIRKPHWMIKEEDVLAAFHALSKNDKAQFLRVRDNATGIFHTMEMAFAENSFAVQISAQAGRVHGFFPLHSRFNHSCLPNSEVPDQVQPDDSIVLYAICDIEAGTEILFCYESDFGCRTRDDRHRILRFECTCQACNQNLSFQVLSDMRRILTRGLNYLTTGRDIGEQVYSSKASSIINDASLRRDAETFNIPMSSRIVYNLLLMALSEQEGLLDVFLEGRMLLGIQYVMRAFETERNREILVHALLQEDWTQRSCTVSAMWGRHDTADVAFVRELRSQNGVFRV